MKAAGWERLLPQEGDVDAEAGPTSGFGEVKNIPGKGAVAAKVLSGQAAGWRGESSNEGSREGGRGQEAVIAVPCGESSFWEYSWAYPETAEKTRAQISGVHFPCEVRFLCTTRFPRALRVVLFHYHWGGGRGHIPGSSGSDQTITDLFVW